MLKASVKALRGPFQSTAAMSRGVFRALSEQKRYAVFSVQFGWYRGYFTFVPFRGGSVFYLVQNKDHIN